MEPGAEREFDDPFVSIWEGPTTEAQALLQAVEASSIPVDLDEAADLGRSRLQVPRSYVEEARGILDAQGFEALLAPPPAPTEEDLSLEDPGSWPMWIRVAIGVVAALIIIGLLASSRGL